MKGKSKKKNDGETGSIIIEKSEPPVLPKYDFSGQLAVRDEEIDVMRKEYDERRKIMVDGFRNMGLDVTEPEGAFYVFPSIKKTGLTSMEFCNRLLQEQKVAVIPGDAFGSCAEGYIRCSYAYSKDIIKKCLEKIAVFVSQFDLK